MSSDLPQDSLNQLFFDARTHNSWQDRDVEDSLLEKVWNATRWGPTSMNCCPARIIFVKTPEAKEKLKPCLSEGNVKQTMTAPVTAIIALDEKFYTHMPTLFPSFPGAADMFAENSDLAEETAFRNATLQAGYFILACRAYGLDCGPMSGFDQDKANEAFFATTTYKANFLCNIGYGDNAGLYPRGPRPAFDEVCQII